MLKPRPQRCAGVIQGYSGVGWQYAEGAMGQRGVLVDDAVVTEELKRRFEELEKEGEAALGYGQRW